ncbi:MAG: TonB-dependent receptor [Acidobacteria bacterium]|nr:TonB-dependent receptor [Acidobacteriota bacterium]
MRNCGNGRSDCARLRGGYGLYWAPWNYAVPSNATSNYGQIGYTNNTVSPQTPGTPTVSLSNPFPNGLAPVTGSAAGYLSGVGTTISYVDQTRTAPRVQQFSIDLQRELPGAMAVTASYIGARGDHLPLGGTVDTVVNINQVDPKYLSLTAAQLSAQIPNPYFGNANAGALATQATWSTVLGLIE